MIKFNKCPCLQLSDECFHTVAPHTNTSQEHKCLNHQNVSGFRKFSFIVLEHLCHLQSTLVFMQKYHYFTTQAPCSLPYLRLLWEILLRIIGGVPWALDMKMVAFTEKKIPLFYSVNSSFSSPTDTVLMLVTYHRNFCSHHGHHLCRGKIGDMMAFPLSQLRAQSSPTFPSVCTPARVCDYGGNVSHEECISLWQ